MNARQIPLFLLSGMGADERVFALQSAVFENLVVPQWLEPAADETLPEFAKRMAESIDPGGPCFLGGASFGGMIAMEMLRHLDVRAAFLIGSVRGSNELPRLVRLCRPVAFVARWLPLEVIQFVSKSIRWGFGRWMPPHVQILIGQLATSDASFLRWAIFAMLRWRGPELDATVPLFQIHGDRDRPLPIRFTQPTTVVRGGGHVISLSHAEEVNAFLRTHMEEANV